MNHESLCNDREALILYFNQIVRDTIAGRYPVIEKDVTTLVALFLQYQYGNYDTLKVQWEKDREKQVINVSSTKKSKTYQLSLQISSWVIIFILKRTTLQQMQWSKSTLLNFSSQISRFRINYRCIY